MIPSSLLIGSGGADQAHAEDAGRPAGAALGLTGGSQELTRAEADGMVVGSHATVICAHGVYLYPW